MRTVRQSHGSGALQLLLRPAPKWWVRRDLQRIRSRLNHGAGALTAAERDYLRARALLLLACYLPMGDEDPERLRWTVAQLDRDREPAA